MRALVSRPLAETFQFVPESSPVSAEAGRGARVGGEDRLVGSEGRVDFDLDLLPKVHDVVAEVKHRVLLVAAPLPRHDLERVSRARLRVPRRCGRERALLQRFLRVAREAAVGGLVEEHDDVAKVHIPACEDVSVRTTSSGVQLFSRSGREKRGKQRKNTRRWSAGSARLVGEHARSDPPLACT
eukprot:1102776-Rhodomonas_salina.2